MEGAFGMKSRTKLIISACKRKPELIISACERKPELISECKKKPEVSLQSNWNGGDRQCTENVQHSTLIGTDIIDIETIDDFIMLSPTKDLSVLDFSFRSSIFNDDDAVEENIESDVVHDIVIIPPQNETQQPANSVIHDIVIIPPQNETQEPANPLIHDIAIIPPQNETQQPANSVIQNTSFTKKGDIRKRKRVLTTPLQQKEEKTARQNGKMVLKPPCLESCIKKCKYFIPEQTRVLINTNYQELEYIEKKRFILSNTSQSKIKERISDLTDDAKRKTRNIQFFLQDKNGIRINICKTFFLTTLGYHKKNDRFVSQTICRSNDHMTVTPDMRGKYDHKVKFDKAILHTHIESFNPSISHYRREHAPNRKYLPSDINATLMYQDFLSKNSTMKCSYDLYRKEIKSKNISFTKLGHEECESCAEFDLHGHNKENIEPNCDVCNAFSMHIKKVEDSRRLYRLDAETESNVDEIFFSVDLQKVIMLPRLDQYKLAIFTPRIIVFNESFVPVGKKQRHLKPIAAIWHEGIAGRKKEDLISSFYAFLLENRTVKKITMWVDNCSAQNKNWSLFSFLVYAVNSTEIVAEEIILKYFEPGHTYMSADSFHHQVELSMKFRGSICDFRDFKDAVQAANSGKVIINEMRPDNFYDWLDHTSQIKIKKTLPRPYVSNMTSVAVKRGKMTLNYTTHYNMDNTIELNFLKLKSLRDGIQLPSSRCRARGVNKLKKETIIKKLCPLMKEETKIFWFNLEENSESNDLNDSFE